MVLGKKDKQTIYDIQCLDFVCELQFSAPFSSSPPDPPSKLLMN